MTTYMFPGQGSQHKGMGAELFAKFPLEVKQANELLGYSIEELCLNDPKQQLTSTEFTQPALYVVETLAFLAKSANPKADYYIGHSLGEYSALFAAGCFDFVGGLKLVKKRGELMAKTQNGGMLAVVNLPTERINTLLKANTLNSIDFANFNSKTQIVLSGPANDIARACDILSKEATLCLPLRVTGAFHSRYMQEVANAFEKFLHDFEFSPPHTPVISNFNAQPYLASTPNIKEYLVKQITHPVRWADCINYLKSKGETEFIEIGPGNILSRLKG